MTICCQITFSDESNPNEFEMNCENLSAGGEGGRWRLMC